MNSIFFFLFGMQKPPNQILNQKIGFLKESLSKANEQFDRIKQQQTWPIYLVNPFSF